MHRGDDIAGSSASSKSVTDSNSNSNNNNNQSTLGYPPPPAGSTPYLLSTAMNKGHRSATQDSQLLRPPSIIQNLSWDIETVKKRVPFSTLGNRKVVRKKFHEDMPSAPVKRMKGKRIERPFVIGSEAWPLDETNTRKPGTDPSHTKGWRVYLRGIEGQPPITTWLRKVQFKIYHTYSNPTRMIEEPPFQIEETGWGGFQVEIKLFFIPEVGTRPQDRTHYLQLEYYGSEEEQQKQKDTMLVRSEYLEVVEFSEPTEQLWDILTDEAQFRAPPKGRGKGKAAMKMEDNGGSVELPDLPTANNPYSKQLEKMNLDMLRKALAEVDRLTAAEDKNMAEALAKLAKLRGEASSS